MWQMIRDRKINRVNQYFASSLQIRWGLLVLATIVFTVSLYPRLIVKKYSYDIGDVAKTDVKASEDFFIEDQETTETNRRQAIESVFAVYDLNPKILKNTLSRIDDAFDTLRDIYEKESEKLTATLHIPASPFIDTHRCAGRTDGVPRSTTSSH